MAKKIKLREIEDNLVYKVRIDAPTNNTGYLKDFDHNGAITLEIVYKNKILLTVIAERLWTNVISVDVETNHKNVKKLNLEFRKTKVNSLDKDTIFKNEIQLVAGVRFVKKILRKVIKEISEAFDFEPSCIKTSRLTGISSNKNSDSTIKKGTRNRNVNIVLNRKR